MGSWWYGHLHWFYYFLHSDLSEIIAFARYLPVTPALVATSETRPLPLQYSNKNCLYLHLYNLRVYLLLTVKMFCYKIFQFVLMLEVKSCEHDDLHIFMSRVRHLSPSISCQIKHLNPNNSSDFSKQKHCHHYHSANIHNFIVLRFILPFHLVVCWLAL